MDHTSLPSPQELSAHIQGFKIQELIQYDEFSGSYSAVHSSLARPVTLKVLPPSIAANPAFKEAFLEQARNLARLNHTHLASVFDMGEQNGYVYIEMEPMLGQLLSELQAERSFTETEIAHVMKGIAQGLQHAHEAGIYHRQLGAEDIMLDTQLNPTISGFSPSETSQTAELDLSADMSSCARLLHIFLTGYDLPDTNQPIAPSQLAQIDPAWDDIVNGLLPHGAYSGYPDFLSAITRFGSTTPSKKSAPVRQLTTASTTSAPHPRAPRVNSSSTDDQAGKTLTRNLAIIALLLGAIFFVFDQYKTKKVEVEKESQANIEKSLKKKKTPLTKPKTTQPVSDTTKETIAATGSTEQASSTGNIQSFTLSELQPQLAAGTRKNYPDGSLEIGDSVFFLHPEKFSWRGAVDEAARHGAFIACPADRSELKELRQLIPDNETVWLGGGMAGADKWAWMMDRKFTFPVKKGSADQRLTSTAAGTLKGLNERKKQRFIFQWKKDGTLPDNSPIPKTDISAGDYPVGTFQKQGRKYYITSKKYTWDAAKKIAQDAGGHLAAASSSLEFKAISEASMILLPKGGSCWIGGIADGSQWSWDTYEEWTGADWQDGKEPPTDKKLRVTSVREKDSEKAGWAAANRTSKRRFMIEWSDDVEKNLPDLKELKGQLAILRAKSAAEVKTISLKRDAILKENSDTFLKQISRIPRQLPKSQQAGMQKIVDQMSLLVKNSMIDRKEASFNPPEKILRIYDHHRKKQTSFIVFARERIQKISAIYTEQLKATFTATDLITQRFLASELEEIESGTDAFETHILSTTE